MFQFKKEKQGFDPDCKTVIAVWGAPSSGKTTVAVELAKAISKQQIKTTLILCDKVAPTLQCILPQGQLIREERSLGELLSLPEITAETVKERLLLIKGKPYLSMLSYLKGENQHSYLPYTNIQAQELIDSACELASVVIVDCASDIANDVLSMTALLDSESVFHLITCDLKSISFLSSQLSLLYDQGFDKDNLYRVLSKVQPNSNKDQVTLSVGKVAFELPYTNEVKEQFYEGDLLADLVFKNSKAFRKTIQKMANETLEM